MELILPELHKETAPEFKKITPREKPCRDMDIDCLALDGIVPFGDYNSCYRYDPSQGKCPFAAGEEG